MSAAPIDNTKYEIDLIDEVICQFRFPPILKIPKGDIAEFQDEIRKLYPNYKDASETPEMAPELHGSVLLLKPRNPAHRFYDDEGWTVALAKDSLALVSTNYVQFEDFYERLKIIVNAFDKIYSPSYYSRVGLRYKNMLCRSALDIKEEWKDLVPEEIFPELYGKKIESGFDLLEKKMTLHIQNGKLNLAHAIFMAEGEYKGKQFSHEQVYTIDIDCYTETKYEEKDSATSVVTGLNKTCKQYFRASITDTMHNYLGPRPK
jgi:uncharacterized protein (TIGR04255 family)